jgi:hypothetical protein
MHTGDFIMRIRPCFSHIQWLLAAFVFSACAATVDEPAPADEPAAVEAPAALQSQVGEPTTSSIPPGWGCSKTLSCNPVSGGTAYCRQALQEPTAWCLKPGPGSSSGVCCFP